MTKKEIKQALIEAFEEVAELRGNYSPLNGPSTVRLVADKLEINFTDAELSKYYPGWDD